MFFSSESQGSRRAGLHQLRKLQTKGLDFPRKVPKYNIAMDICSAKHKPWNVRQAVRTSVKTNRASQQQSSGAFKPIFAFPSFLSASIPRKQLALPEPLNDLRREWLNSLELHRNVSVVLWGQSLGRRTPSWECWSKCYADWQLNGETNKDSGGRRRDRRE